MFKSVELLTQIHDSVVFQIPLSIPFIEHARMIMLIKDSLEQSLEWHGTEIKTPADLCIGLNMCKEDMKEIKSKNFPSNIEQLSEMIENSYNGLKNV